MTNINSFPLSTVHNLMNAFPGTYCLKTMETKCRSIPIGIEIEVSWRSFFPDLWVDGFPNVDEATLADITAMCKIREQYLLPQLMLAERCGVPSGADKYWEFAFNPVTDINILRNQVHILQQNNLIPVGDQHALHITVGGLRPTHNLYYVALILESYACDSTRIRSGMGEYGITKLSKGWARKGRAALFHKQGDHDMQHGYEDGTEFRLLYTPPTLDRLSWLLDRCQVLCDIASDPLHPKFKSFYYLMKAAGHVLLEHGLPDINYGKPHENPEIWAKFADNFDSIADKIRTLFELSPLVDYDPQLV